MSLKEFLDPNSIANEIRLERQVHEIAFLVVEGTDDRKFFSKFVESALCSIVPAYGKDRVVKVVSLLEHDNFHGVLGVVDRDFDEIEQVAYEVCNIVVTDEHDLECMMLRSEAFARLLVEIANEATLATFEARVGGVKGFLLDRAKVIGCARLASRRGNLNLNFDELQFRFVDRESLDLDLDRFVNQVVSRTSNCCVTRPELLRLITVELEEDHDIWQICCGHDIISILAIAIRRCIGRAAGPEADPAVVASKLRLAFSPEEFRSTSMFVAICRWEARQPQFAFIRGPCPEL
jgi:Protein of unknown function (DUF4435)